MRTGRPRNLGVRLALLERLPHETVGEMLRSGSFSRPQLSHYLRELRRLGYIEPRVYFSHLDTDGPGAKRYGLTRSGRRYRDRLRSTESHRPPVTESPAVEPARGPARVVDRPAPRSATTRSAQRYVGVHNLCYSMLVEAGFRRPFHWEREYPMANGSWIKRHAPFGKGIHLEESGGRRWDQAGAAGHVISVKFRVDATEPEEAEARAERVVQGIRRTLEREYGCSLSEPERRVAPKHSIVGDPMAAAVRGTGVSVHGDVGVDDTPEPGTLELDSARAVREYVDGVKSVGTLSQKVDMLLAAVAELQKAAAATVEASAAQTGVLREILSRLPKAPEGPQVPIKPSNGEGYA